jgi:hypothetical protein
VDYYRDGKAFTAHVQIAELPPAPAVLAILGFGLREIPATEGGQGSLIEIDRVVNGGPAFQGGLRPGTRVLGVGEQPTPVKTLSEFDVAVSKLDLNRGLPLVVQSGDDRPRGVRLMFGRAREQR